MRKFLTVLEWILASICFILGILILFPFDPLSFIFACIWFSFGIGIIVLFEKWKGKLANKTPDRRNYRK